MKYFIIDIKISRIKLLNQKINGYSLTILVSLLFLSNAVEARTKLVRLQIAKQPAISELNETRVEAEKLMKEASELSEKGTAESLLSARKKFEAALVLWQQLGDKEGQAFTLNNIGKVYEDLGEKQKAFAYYSQVLPLARALGNKSIEAITLANTGWIYSSLGEKQKALAYYNKALPLARALGDENEEAAILNNIAKVYSDLGRNQEALAYYNKALSLVRAVENKDREANILVGLAYLERQQGNLQSSLKNIESALAIIEQLRGTYTDQNLKTSYFATVQDNYKFYIDLLMELDKKNPGKNYAELALNVSEHSRARGLLELLTEANAKIRKGANPELLQKESDLLQKIDAIEQLLQQQKSRQEQNEIIAESIKNLETELEIFRNQYQELQTAIRQSNPKYASLKYPQPLNLQQIQQQLDNDSVLLQYSIGEERSYLWAVTPNSLNVYELPSRKVIELQAKKFRSISNISGPPPEVIEAANNLSKILLEAVADKIAGKRLLIVADEILQTTPFAALADIKVKAKEKNNFYQPLIVNHEIVNLPSASTIAIQRQELANRKPAPKQLAILADPVYSETDTRVTGKPESNLPGKELNIELERSLISRSLKNLQRDNLERLPHTANEAQAILNLVNSSGAAKALDFDANFTWATNPILNQFRILHFATHGIADTENPENSHLVLSLVDKQGKPIRGLLRLGDLFNQDYPAELIVLSACETGLGKDISGEGIVGLTRGLMYAGAARVAVSLWSVNDEGTSVFMEEFYTQMIKHNKTPAAAMREAQIKFWQNPEWGKPYYWAAFTISGEWR